MSTSIRRLFCEYYIVASNYIAIYGFTVCIKHAFNDIAFHSQRKYVMLNQECCWSQIPRLLTPFELRGVWNHGNSTFYQYKDISFTGKTASLYWVCDVFKAQNNSGLKFWNTPHLLIIISAFKLRPWTNTRPEICMFSEQKSTHKGLNFNKLRRNRTLPSVATPSSQCLTSLMLSKAHDAITNSGRKNEENKAPDNLWPMTR